MTICFIAISVTGLSVGWDYPQERLRERMHTAVAGSLSTAG
jgi:hypothetical protein